MLDKSSRILLVDDSDVMSTMLKPILEEMGYKNIEVAADGAIALEMMEDALDEDRSYILVFTDWKLPNMTGIELIQACHKDEDLRKIPIVMITADSESDHVAQALRAGAVEFIVKPFSRDSLHKKLEKLSKRFFGAH